MRIGDALDHSTIAPGRYDLIALDVYDETNNVPRPFCDRAFADGIATRLADDGVFVANFRGERRRGRARTGRRAPTNQLSASCSRRPCATRATAYSWRPVGEADASPRPSGWGGRSTRGAG